MQSFLCRYFVSLQCPVLMWNITTYSSQPANCNCLLVVESCTETWSLLQWLDLSSRDLISPPAHLLLPLSSVYLLFRFPRYHSWKESIGELSAGTWWHLVHLKIRHFTVISCMKHRLGISQKIRQHTLHKLSNMRSRHEGLLGFIQRPAESVDTPTGKTFLLKDPSASL